MSTPQPGLISVSLYRKLQSENDRLQSALSALTRKHHELGEREAEMRDALREAAATMGALNAAYRPSESVSLDVQTTIARCERLFTTTPTTSAEEGGT